ncbi:hypothetical protein LBMAG42_18790 [Deltaproteobacteria bacterium]|nr:hypothetical protein LBMAG42_18790 [Deltaproteobacteria bacterium]
MSDSQLAYPFSRTWWITPGRVLGGGYPGSTKPDEVDPRLRGLLDVGVTQVICLQEANELGHDKQPFADYYPRLAALAAERGTSVFWARFPVRDVTAPPDETMRAVLARLHAHPGVTYVHCWGGHGRTATVAGCWLREAGLSADEALTHIRAARAHDDYLVGQRAPQAPDQHDIIRRWAAAPR